MVHKEWGQRDAEHWLPRHNYPIYLQAGQERELGRVQAFQFQINPREGYGEHILQDSSSSFVSRHAQNSSRLKRASTDI